MSLPLIVIGTFLVTSALVMCAIYFLVVSPSKNRELRSRLQAIQNSASAQFGDPQSEIFRREVLSQLPALNRIMVQVPIFVRLNLLLQQAGMELTVGKLMTIVISTGAAVFLGSLLVNLPLLLSLLLALCGGALPFIVVSIKRQQRFAKFDQQFPEAIDLLARAVRAGHAFTTGLELIGNEMQEPVAAEFRRTYEQQNLGLPLREALQNLLVRVPLPDVHIFVTALLIQRESGGNLGEILDNLSRVIRERFKLMQQVKVFTAQGRVSLYVLSALAPLLGFVLYLLNPKYIARLFADPLGHRMLVAAVLMEIIGYLTIAKITKLKV